MEFNFLHKDTIVVTDSESIAKSIAKQNNVRAVYYVFKPHMEKFLSESQIIKRQIDNGEDIKILLQYRDTDLVKSISSILKSNRNIEVYYPKGTEEIGRAINDLEHQTPNQPKSEPLKCHRYL